MPSVVVIGAGASGLTALKSLLEERLDAVAYEANYDVGGIWAYRDEPGGHPTVMNCTVMNTSKELSAFSDFPPPMSSPNFMHHRMTKEYLHQYAKHFNLLNHIRLGHRVEDVRPAVDYTRTGCWDVTTLNLETGERKVTTFDAVVVCSGKHAKPRLPFFPGLEHFKGRVRHSSEYKSSEEFKGKNVLIIGIGNSASDIAVELSGLATKTYLSSRSGAWLFGRLTSGGHPADLQMITRFKFFLNTFLPYNLVCSYVESFLGQRVDHDLYHLRPAYRALSHYPTITDELHLKMSTGQVILRKDVETFTEKAVRFEDDPDNYVQIDEVILATGYEESFPFLDPVYSPTKDGKLNLFMYVFPPCDNHHTLAFMGMVYAFGPQLPGIEMQGRWIARVMSGKCKLPSRDVMIHHVVSNHERVIARFGASSLLSGQMDWLPFLDKMAELVGVKPRLWSLVWKDPQLFFKCVFGPAVSYMYRLEGPHAWSGAREAIMGVQDRVRSPYGVITNTKEFKKKG